MPEGILLNVTLPEVLVLLSTGVLLLLYKSTVTVPGGTVPPSMLFTVTNKSPTVEEDFILSEISSILKTVPFALSFSA